MSFASAFQTSAFQAGAFLTGNGTFNSAGIGSVADFRGEERNRRSQNARERKSKDDLTRIINEVFDGKPMVVAANESVETEEPHAPDYFEIFDALVQNQTIRVLRRQQMVLRAEIDRQTLELLLLVT
jgi:hypothetical protein